MKTRSPIYLILSALILAAPAAALADDQAISKPVVGSIGTGDMGDSLGPRFAELGYAVVYGSRNPSSERAQNLAKRTGDDARVTTQKEAAQAGEIVVLVVPWPPMETVA